MSKSIKHIIFDFDGVIVDSFDFHFSRLKAFSQGRITKQDYKNAHNGNINKAEISALKNIDWPRYAESIVKDFSKLPVNQKTKEFLKELAEVYKLYIVTSAPSPQVMAYLENHKIKNIFSAIFTKDDHFDKTENLLSLLNDYHITTDEVIFITDTLGDLKAANQVSIKTIAVTFGFHDQAKLAEGNPTHLANFWDKVREILV